MHNNRQQRTGRIGLSIAVVSLLVAIAAYVPSAAAFTPAVLLSFLAAIGAIVTVFAGFIRLGVVTLSVVAATVLISPIFGWPEIVRVDLVMVACAAAIVVVAALLFWDFRRRRASASRYGE
jgi:hypothetical protein